MIGNVSFSGKVLQAGSVAKLSRPSEIRKIQKFSNRNDCDVILTDRDYYIDGTGVYKSILVKEDKLTGKNLFAEKTFDFAINPKAGNIPIKPEYMPSLRELYV